LYKIINTETQSDIDGPYEVFEEVYKINSVDRSDLVAMSNLASDLNANCDGHYVVVPKEDV